MRAKSNPFQGRREDLSQRSLSDEEKLFIGSLVGKDKETTRSVGEFYQIGKSTVGRYSRYYKDKEGKEGRVGRLGRVARLIRLGIRASSPTRAYNHFIEQLEIYKFICL